jgi:hypothetical protein
MHKRLAKIAGKVVKSVATDPRFWKVVYDQFKSNDSILKQSHQKPVDDEDFVIDMDSFKQS